MKSVVIFSLFSVLLFAPVQGHSQSKLPFADITGDGCVDMADAVIFKQNLGKKTTLGAKAGDFNGNGYVDGGDSDFLSVSLYSCKSLFTFGDANGDRCFNSADRSILRTEYGKTAQPNQPLRSDFNSDNIVNRLDYDITISNVGKCARHPYDFDANGCVGKVDVNTLSNFIGKNTQANRRIYDINKDKKIDTADLEIIRGFVGICVPMY